MKKPRPPLTAKGTIQTAGNAPRELAPPMAPIGTEQYVTRQQVADLLHVHTETVKRWARAGRLRAFVFSGTVTRYALSDVQRLIEEARSPVRPAA